MTDLVEFWGLRMLFLWIFTILLSLEILNLLNLLSHRQTQRFRFDGLLYYFSILINDWPGQAFDLILKLVLLSNHLDDVVKAAFNTGLSFYNLSVVLSDSPNSLASL